MQEYLPYGDNAHNLNPETLECPICNTRLLPIEAIYSDKEAEIWRVECKHCHTEYITHQPAGRLEVPKSTRDYISALEQRILNLEQIIKTIANNNSREVNRKTPPTSKYAFLLNS